MASLIFKLALGLGNINETKSKNFCTVPKWWNFFTALLCAKLLSQRNQAVHPRLSSSQAMLQSQRTALPG